MGHPDGVHVKDGMFVVIDLGQQIDACAYEGVAKATWFDALRKRMSYKVAYVLSHQPVHKNEVDDAT